MRRTSLIAATLAVALAGPVGTAATAGPALADGPVLPGNAHGTTVSVTPSKILPGAALRVNVRCMTHVGGVAAMKVASPAFPTVAATRQQFTFSRPTDPKLKPGTYTIRADCKAPGAFVKKSPLGAAAVFTVAAPPAPAAPPQRRMGPALRRPTAHKPSVRQRALPGVGRHTQTRRVPIGGAATGFGPVLGR